MLNLKCPVEKTTATFHAGASLFLLWMTVNPSLAEPASYQEKFGAWMAFKDGTDCWIVADIPDLKIMGNAEVAAFVTFFDQQTESQFSLVTTQDVEHHDKLNLFAGPKRFELTFAEDTAFALIHDEIPILRSILSGDEVRFLFTASDGQEVSGLVPSEGFKQAYNYLSSICEFRFNDKLSVEVGVEPS